MRKTTFKVLFLVLTSLIISCSQSGKPKKGAKTVRTTLVGETISKDESSTFIEVREKDDANLENQVFVAKVIRILDGDTMEILRKNAATKIRLAHIDCPEKKGSQPFGNNAKKALSDLCFGQNVTIYGEKYDRYHRLIAVVINDKEQVINQEMIKQGMAWHFKRYSSDSVYSELEIAARRNKRGLWSDPHPIPPWQWRNH